MSSILRSAAETSVQRVRALWGKGTPRMEEVAEALKGCDVGAMAEGVVEDAEERWERGLPARLEEYRAGAEVLTREAECRRALLMCEVSRRGEEAAEAVRADLLARHPGEAGEIEAVMELAALLRPAAEETGRGELIVGERIGKYELVRALGSGSFGEVWQARDVELDRYVALKLLFAAAGEEGEEGAGRFIAEARAAAALNHEHIVTVHGAGVLTTAEGERRGYIDSLLVGDPAPTAEDPIGVEVGTSLEAGIAGRVGERGKAREAARIVEAISRGIAAAHARGVLHRDIKPANVLVTPSGRPLVADFGLSISGMRVDEAEGGANADATLRTVSVRSESGGRIVGTPAYMAPEQARGEAATPLTDVFALGGVLRFLLTGKPAYSPSGRFSPDARMDVLAQARGAELGSVRAGHPEIPRTLGAIVDRAMAGRPEERYVSAEQLAADLCAWLEHRPTVADRPGRVGATGLWYRRNVAAATVGVIALGVIGGGTWRFVDGLRYERDRANVAREEAETKRKDAEEARDITAAVNQFMQESMFLAVSSRPGERVAVDDLMASAMRRVGTTLKGRPLTEAGVRQMLGTGLHGFGNIDGARKQLELALAIRRERLGEDAPDTVRTRVALARLDATDGRNEAADSALRELMPLCERVLGSDAPETCLVLRTHGRLLLHTRRLEEGERLLRAAAERAERAFGTADRRTLDAWSDLSVLPGMRGDEKQMIEMARRLVDGYARTYGEDDPGTFTQRIGLGYALRRGRMAEEAATEYRRAYAGLLKASGARNNGAVSAGMQLAQVLVDDLGRAQEGLEVAREAAANTTNPVESPLYWEVQMVLARAQAGVGDVEGGIATAKALFERAEPSPRAGAAAMSAAKFLAAAYGKRGGAEDASAADMYRTYVREHQPAAGGK